ncbi:DUF3575 domain-containing protein [Pontibacter sp. E15-1]|uniref:DUF3575 domain-containing protein n=1 Tax=Pontibacter sp. E15-1 TaxID=2919918 RepID=UPI001F4F4DFF|nr:DUF3575 domain-containing protein [Pontibacter sp. E15-1]MCJ8163869.1 DUF3575 domain-containing protein [Pontibacter sp. E15-1]
MKKYATLIVLFTVFHAFAHAAPLPGGGGKTEPGALKALSAYNTMAKKERPDEVFRKNIIKINLSSLALDNYSLSYERSLSRKITAVAGYSFIPKTDVASIYLVDKVLKKYTTISDETMDELEAATLANKAYTGELRLYTGRNAGARGFYVSLYGRYMDLDATYTHEYEIDGKSYILPVAGNVEGLGGGLMFGAQWLIARRLTFDWYVIGAHYGRLNVNASAVTDLSTMTPQEQRELEEDIESVNDQLDGRAEIKATVTDEGVSIKGNAPFAGIRGLGFSLGIAF